MSVAGFSDLLRAAVENLNEQLYPDGISPCPVMREWTTHLPLRCQGVIVTGIRGCDGAPKEDPSKCLTAMIRRAVLNPADQRETTYERGFFGFSKPRILRELPDFFHSLDQYPMHYIAHLMHVCEVIGYTHPSPVYRNFFSIVYFKFAKSLHLAPESKEAMIERLTFDRVAAGTVERDK